MTSESWRSPRRDRRSSREAILGFHPVVEDEDEDVVVALGDVVTADADNDVENCVGVER